MICGQKPNSQPRHRANFTKMAKGFIIRRSRRRRGLKPVIVVAGRRAALKGRARIRRAQRGFVRTAGLFGITPGEMKFFDQDINDPAIASGGTIFTNGSAEASLLRIPEGNGASERIGRTITIKSIGWRFKITFPTQTLGNSTNDVVRVILYLDKQANGAAAAITDILAADDFQAFNNLANKSRFRTLMDRTYDMNLTAGSGQNAADEYGEMGITDTLFKRVNLKIEYATTAATGALATIRSNNICMLILSNSGLCVMDGVMRLRYSDN